MNEKEWKTIQSKLDIDRYQYVQSLNDLYLEGELNDSELIQFVGDILNDPSEVNAFMLTLTPTKKLQNLTAQYQKGYIGQLQVIIQAISLFNDSFEYDNYISNLINSSEG